MELQKLIDGLKSHKSGAAAYESVDEAIRVFEAMRDVDGEKVRKGLEICTESTRYEDCITCPYHEDYYPNVCRHANKKDALALIRQQHERIAELEGAQTARVMTLEEVVSAECVWIEYAVSGDVVIAFPWDIELTDDTYNFVCNPNCIVEFKSLYGKEWRCWTKRPTDEQRKAVRWNG